MNETHQEHPSIVDGIEHGPWKAHEGNVQQRMEWGLTEDEALAALDSYEKARKIGSATYRSGLSAELKELHDTMADDYTQRINNPENVLEKNN